MHHIIRIYFVLIAGFVYSQNGFYKVYSNNGYDFGQGIVQLPDSSYVVTGASSSFSSDQNTDAFLLHVDSKGKYKKSFHYGGSETDWARRIIWDGAKAFYLVGYSNSYGKNDYDGMVIKVDTNGQQIWNKHFGKDGWDKFNDAVLLKDSSLVLVGETKDNQSNDKDIYIVRIQKNGDTLWTKTFHNPGEDYLTSVQLVQDSLLFLAGTTYKTDSLLQKAYLIKMRLNGDTIWTKTYGKNGNYFFHDFCVISNHLNLVGETYLISTATSGILSRIDLNGNEAYTFEDPITGSYTFKAISSTLKQDHVYLTYEMSNSPLIYPGGCDLSFARYKENLLWDSHSVNISSYGDDKSGEIISSLDSGMVLVGYNSAFNNGGGNVLIYKIGKDEVFPSTIGTPSIQHLVQVEELTSNSLHIYPNPVESTLYLTTDKIGSLYTILDFTGKTIQEGILSTAVDVAQLSSGVYFLRIKYADSENRLKFVKK